MCDGRGSNWSPRGGNMSEMERQLGARFLIEVLADREMTPDERDAFRRAYANISPGQAEIVVPLITRIEWIKKLIRAEEFRRINDAMNDLRQEDESKGERPMAMPTVTGSGPSRERGPVQDEIASLWVEIHDLGNAHRAALARIVRLEVEMRGESVDDEDAGSPGKARVR